MNLNSFDCVIPLRQKSSGNAAGAIAAAGGPVMEFHVCRSVRDLCGFDETLFAFTGNVILANFKAVREFAQKINATIDPILHPEKIIRAGQLNAMGLIDEIFHYVCALYRRQKKASVFSDAAAFLEENLGRAGVDALLAEFTADFPPSSVYRGEMPAAEYLAASSADGYPNRTAALEELILLRIANENPACEPFFILFDDTQLAKNPNYDKSWELLHGFFEKQPEFGPENKNLIAMLMSPVEFSPHSLKGQLDYIRTHWGMLLGEWLLRLLSGIDMIQEEEKPGWSGNFSVPPPMDAYTYDSMMKEYERFSPDREWMPRVVLMAKTILVWLSQLSEKYERSITRLDQIPDEELDILAQEGFTGLWLIGIWERSWASRRIKQINGNPEAAASAYSLDDYEIAQELGGWDALDNLRRRLWYRGIRLASDMVPNHTGMDAKWVIEKPDLFIQRKDCPYPGYSFNGENLSRDSRVSVFLEDHYYSKSDCAVVFKRVDNYTGDTRYIYHGNDGTGMPWNDTAQIDFLNPQAREEVIKKILHVARNFPIIRFDAAMVLAKKHIERLWYPEPGHGGDIATRSESALSRDEFNRRIPEEFWREVVDRCAAELPDTLLLAEAFWMMEGYFVRTLGMHRVYNSAFMNMLKREENEKYRSTIKNTLEFDPQVLRRFVNFMNNPDEETAVAQFGKGDKYFGVCTLMITMPGLPMFGHGQIEGFSEKYGMEFTKAYWNEVPDTDLIERHKRDIFPLIKKRYLFAEVENFYLYDLWDSGRVNENVFAYSNNYGDEKSVVLYNNVYQQTVGWIKRSSAYAVKTGPDSRRLEQKELAAALGLSNDERSFCIFQEHRSGLWYIRTCRELHEQGLFVRLNGYESQVLLNIHEVRDAGTNQYRVLYDYLAGRGVPDIKVAMQEIFLKELYEALMEFASPDLFSGAAVLMKAISLPSDGKKVKTVKFKDVLDKAEPAARRYFETLARFISGNYGSDSVFDPANVGPEVPVEEAWARFSLRFARMVKIREMAENPVEGISVQAAEAIKKLYQGILARPFMTEFIVGYNILCSIRDVIGDRATAQDSQALINLWCLDRKVRDAMTEYGIPSRDSFFVLKVMLELLPCLDQPLLEGSSQESGWQIIKMLVESDSGRSTLGLNMYDHVLWFNQEKTDDALFYGSLIYSIQGEPAKKCISATMLDVVPAMEGLKVCSSVYKPHKFSLPQWNKELTALYSLSQVLNTAKNAAEYRAERFVELLKPAESAASVKKAKSASVQKTVRKDKK